MKVPHTCLKHKRASVRRALGLNRMRMKHASLLVRFSQDQDRTAVPVLFRLQRICGNKEGLFWETLFVSGQRQSKKIPSKAMRDEAS